MHVCVLPDITDRRVHTHVLNSFIAFVCAHGVWQHVHVRAA
jgi:hypothetical protein